MIDYLIRRITFVFPIVAGVSLLVFLLIHMIPGDPVVLMLGESAQQADIERVRHDLGLDKPLHEQLIGYVKGLLRLNLGRSLHRRVPVIEILKERFPATIELTIISLMAALIIALPLGILSAVRSGSWIDSISMFISLIGISMPNFWLGPLLILFFSVKLDWFPVSGRSGPLSYILPAITLGTALAAVLTRMTRSSLLEVIHEQYVFTATSKGLSRSKVILKHALRNALIPVVTIVGLQFGSLLGGSIITETVFSWPGIGRELIQAIQGRDYPVVQGCILLISFMYVAVNLMTDLIYAFIDPRIQFKVDAVRKDVRTHRADKTGWRRLKPLSVPVLFVIICIFAIKFSGRIPWVGSAKELISIAGQSLILKGLMSLLPLGALFVWRRKDIRTWSRFMRNKGAVIGLLISLLFILSGIWGPDLAPYDPAHQELSLRLHPPDRTHWLGMDGLGRDLLSRILTGSRVSIYVGITVTAVSLLLGTALGLLSGYYGGWIDELIMRIVDILLAFPGILLAIALVAVLGPSINHVIIALCIMGWVGYARLARGQVLSVRQQEYVLSGTALGASSGRIMIKYVLPNILAPLIVQATLGMAGVIVAEAGLSFLGLGVQPPHPSWGGLLNTGIDYFREGPHLTVFPGLAIMLVVIGLNFLGDGLRDALDPKMDV